MDAVRSLPKPLPLPAQDHISPLKKDEPKREEELREEGSVDDLTSEELLQTHIKHAKRVRSRGKYLVSSSLSALCVHNPQTRLREEKLQRIARYKTRLALLLPLVVVEQQLRNDSASGN